MTTLHELCTVNCANRPSRSRTKDNPYTIFATQDTGAQMHYYVRFCDSCGRNQEIEITEELYQAFDRFELDDVHEINQRNRHKTLSLDAMSPEQIESLQILNDPEEQLINVEFSRYQNECLTQAMALLTETQHRRLVKHYFQNMSYTEISEIEGVSLVAVRQSILAALKTMNVFLKNSMVDH